MDTIRLRGARTHNLKNIDLDLPRDKLIVITGVSGCGKSSLAFDTIYAEGQRRYVESLSAYARQFLSVMEKPDLDHIEGLSSAISIEQKSTPHNPRSTVGTITEIYDYLRLLFACAGTPPRWRPGSNAICLKRGWGWRQHRYRAQEANPSSDQQRGLPNSIPKCCADWTKPGGTTSSSMGWTDAPLPARRLTWSATILSA